MAEILQSVALVFLAGAVILLGRTVRRLAGVLQYLTEALASLLLDRTRSPQGDERLAQALREYSDAFAKPKAKRPPG